MVGKGRREWAVGKGEEAGGEERERGGGEEGEEEGREEREMM